MLSAELSAVEHSRDPSSNLCPFDHPGQWFVLHTKSRQEKALACDLASRHIAHFLPLRTEIRYHGKRKRVVDVPLFPNYLFAKGFPRDSYIADRTKRVANIIPCPDQQKITFELQNISVALLHGAPLSLYPAMVRGTRVEVRAGPFRGIQGIIENRAKLTRANGNRLILKVETLGRAVSFEIDGSLLDVIEPNTFDPNAQA
jgi:transcriptional antiterminator NusG